MHINTLQYLNDDSVILSSRETSSIIKIKDVSTNPSIDYIIGNEDFWKDTDYTEYLYTKVGDLALIEDKDKIYLPKKHLVEYERYYDKFKNYMSMGDGQGHMMMTPERIEAFYKAQCLKDDTMAESIVEFLNEHKDTKVLHVQGAFHGDEHLGVVEKVNKLNPSLKTIVITPIEAKDYEKVKNNYGKDTIIMTFVRK